MARPVERIAPFLKQLQALWEENPDFRFHQLVRWVAKDKDCFYREDDATLKVINELLRKV